MMRIDINSDLGEGYGRWNLGDDTAMLEIVTSANIACGFHAGDPASILDTVRGAARAGVSVGAHVAYHDLAGFGRRNMDVDSRELIADVIYQIGALQGLAAAAGTRVGYVKPHGALYNTIARDERQARDVLTAIREVDPELTVMGLAGSVVHRLAEKNGQRFIAEAFADRAYTPGGELVSRRVEGSVLHDAEEIAGRMLRLVTEGRIEAIDGTLTRVDAQSLCVHGDSPGAVEMARAVRAALEGAGIRPEAFLPAPPASPVATGAGENR